MTADQFLSKLPASVVRSGRVIDIRGSLSQSVKGTEAESNPCPVTIVQTEAMQEIKDRYACLYYVSLCVCAGILREAGKKRRISSLS